MHFGDGISARTRINCLHELDRDPRSRPNFKRFLGQTKRRKAGENDEKVFAGYGWSRCIERRCVGRRCSCLGRTLCARSYAGSSRRRLARRPRAQQRARVHRLRALRTTRSARTSRSQQRLLRPLRRARQRRPPPPTCRGAGTTASRTGPRTPTAAARSRQPSRPTPSSRRRICRACISYAAWRCRSAARAGRRARPTRRIRSAVRAWCRA